MHPQPTLDLLKVDAQNRESAIDTRGSFIIEAPAGAGKTELLTQRFLALLTQVNDPEEIVALTFTNKAAAEMRERVLSSLRLAATGATPSEAHRQTTFNLGLRVLDRDRKNGWNLLEQAGRLQVTTLDAFCGKLARQMPLLSRFGSQPAITTDPELLYRQAAQDSLALLEAQDGASDSIARVLAYFDNDSARFTGLLETMLASRDQWLRHSRTDLNLTDAEDALSALIEQELTIIAAVMSPIVQSGIIEATRFAASQAILSKMGGELPEELVAITALEDWSEPLLPCVQDLPRWRGLLEMLLTKSGGLRTNLAKPLGLSRPEGKLHGKAVKVCLEDLKAINAGPILERIRKLPSPFYDDQEHRFIEDLMTVLKIATAKLWLNFKSAREVDFIQMAQNALLALGDDDAPTNLQLQLDYRINHLLVDEFQDTSPTQVELLKKLTSGWQVGDGRTLFLVGDPMQSIYKFRKADVGLFIRIRESGLGQIQLTPLQLYRNNRSHEQVVDWVNDSFPGVFSQEDNYHRGAVRFAPAKATKGRHELAGAKFHPIISQSQTEIDEDDAPLSPADQREAQKVIALIRTAQQADPESSIAVLVRARSHLDALVSEFRLHEPRIRFQAVEIEALAERQVIQDLACLTRAMFHRADRTNWLAVLRAPWCGLTLADLHALVADDHATPVWALMLDDARVARLSGDGQMRLKHVRDAFTEAFAHQGRQRPRRWIEGLWQYLGGPLCLQESRDYLDTQAFFKVLDAIEDQGTIDLNRIETELADLFAAPDPSAPANVQVMTIHKSKGLEFDTVILPGLHRKPPPSKKKLLLWDEVIGSTGEESLVVAALPSAKDAEGLEPSKFEFLNAFETERSHNESQRLLYVAATRGKRQLHLLGIATPNPKDEGSLVRPPVKGSLLALLWHVAERDFEAQAQAQKDREQPFVEPSVEIDATTFEHQLVRLSNPQIPQAMLVTPAIQSRTSPGPVVADEDRADNANSLAADVGTLVHRYLEMIATDGLEHWPSSRVQGLTENMARWFAMRGHDSDQCRSAVSEVIQHLITTAESPDGRWILGQHESAECEVPITNSVGDTLQSHVIDRTFIDKGVRWIIDYKTAKTEIQNQTALAEETIEGFRQQLERYKSLYSGKHEEITLAVFLTHHGRLQVLT